MHISSFLLLLGPGKLEEHVPYGTCFSSLLPSPVGPSVVSQFVAPVAQLQIVQVGFGRWVWIKRKGRVDQREKVEWIKENR